jgi:hypothetical protein
MKAAPELFAGRCRDLALAVAVSQLDDAARVGIREVAAFFSVSPLTLKRPEARRALGIGEPLEGSRHLKWTMADLRRTAATIEPRQPRPAKKIGRPTKAEQMRKSQGTDL